MTVVGVPDAEYDAKLEAEEKKAVKAIAEALSEKEKEKIVNEAVALRESQDATQDVSVLPTLVVADAVPRAVKKWGSVLDATAGAGGKPLQIDAQPTNGLTYVNVLFDLTDLPDRLAPYVDLFADYVTELGTAARDYKELAQYEKLKTGGIGAGVDAKMSLDGSGATEVYVSFSGHCLDRNVSETLGLMAEIATSAKWRGESERVALLLSRRAASAGASVAQQGMQHASAAASIIAAESAPTPHVWLAARRDAAEAGQGQDAGGRRPRTRSPRSPLALTRENVAVPRRVRPGRRSTRARAGTFPRRLESPRETPSAEPGARRARSRRAGLKAFVSVPQQTNYCAASYATVRTRTRTRRFCIYRHASRRRTAREVREKTRVRAGAPPLPRGGSHVLLPRPEHAEDDRDVRDRVGGAR